MITLTKSATSIGIAAYPVEIEVDISHGLPQFNIVGLPDTSVKEARERVRAAIKNSGFPFPQERITVNLAPANLRKEGPSFDLPIAIGILASQSVISSESMNDFLFLGELALDGALRPFRGALVIANTIQEKMPMIFPVPSAEEAALEQKAKVYAANHLKEVVDFLNGEKSLVPLAAKKASIPFAQNINGPDFSEIKGQFGARRAIEIAVAGGHNLLLVGPPGSGKTMLARRIPTILPPLNFEEAIEITKIHSVAGLIQKSCSMVQTRPFRMPHYSISQPALTGGGSWPKPGEISLAHCGVLFLDEFPEFRRDVLEALRTPLEDGIIHISRAKSQASFPSDFTLAAAMNPCPCGYLSDKLRPCRCSLQQIQKYRTRISGPILDRIDLHVEVPPIHYQTVQENTVSENSESIRKRILECRQTQTSRYTQTGIKLNARMKPREIKEHIVLNSEAKKLMESAMKGLHLSARSYFKILKVARTIADLSLSHSVQAEHLAEAIQYRFLDRQWQA